MPIPPTQIFIARLDALQNLDGLLSCEEHERAAAFPSARRRRQFVAGRSLLRLALSHGSSSPPAAWRFDSRDGKPLLNAASGPYFSLSHSSDWVGCAINHGQVCGFDLQHHADRSLPEIAATFFPGAECAWLDTQREFAPAFYMLWTLKEAWAKAMGLPLLQALREACFAPPENHATSQGMQAYSAPVECNTTMAWVVAGKIQACQGWRWEGTGFATFDLHARRWAPRYHTLPALSAMAT